MHKIISIGGSDSIAGAGIQADIRTACNLNVYCATVVTCITSQNSKGVHSIHPLDNNIVKSQLDAIFEDFIPDVIKIGMLPNTQIIDTVIKSLTPFHSKIRIVYDPILAPTYGEAIFSNDQPLHLKLMEDLTSISYIVTPNLKEISALNNIRSKYMIIKGGHGESKNCCTDILYRIDEKGNKEEIMSCDSPRVMTENTHGTGCVYSTALASYLSMQHTLSESVILAQQFVVKALNDGKNRLFGSGYGPTLWANI
ncbi:MAG: hydroxymethylpyrimidine/phosphomethylpyrimidine kinase [Muribaculaceae bacterium]|nr:hydroxymethylpyrimidine/phosphomethylpyrimidine kinase [Muribaculaceae bacterium]